MSRETETSPESPVVGLHGADPKRLRLLDLFSGIGGFSLGLERTGGFETVAFCEIDPFCRRVLAKHWPEVPCYDDVRTLSAARLAADGIAGIDAICGGFPCQDISEAGQRAGLDGERSGLWSEIARLSGELRPRVVLVENVSDLLTGAGGAWFARVLGDMAALGYDAVWNSVQAANIGAKHIRDRVWIAFLADASCTRLMQCWWEQFQTDSDSQREIRQRFDQPEPLRVANGIPDRSHRNKALGNAVVPQIPELIGRAILASEFMTSSEAVAARLAPGGIPPSDPLPLGGYGSGPLLTPEQIAEGEDAMADGGTE